MPYCSSTPTHSSNLFTRVPLQKEKSTHNSDIFLRSSVSFRLLYSIHIESTAANNDKNKGSRTLSTTSDQYDDIGSAAGDKKGGHSDAEHGGVAAGEGSAVSQELKAVFVETMRAVSVDSTCSTVSETSVPVTPSQCVADRPLFESRA